MSEPERPSLLRPYLHTNPVGRLTPDDNRRHAGKRGIVPHQPVVGAPEHRLIRHHEVGAAPTRAPVFDVILIANSANVRSCYSLVS